MEQCSFLRVILYFVEKSLVVSKTLFKNPAYDLVHMTEKAESQLQSR